MHNYKKQKVNSERTKFQKLFFPTIILIYLLSCANENNPNEPGGDYLYEVPPETGDGWETASMATVGMDHEYLVSLMHDLENIYDHRIHSLLIIKDAKLVFEEYFAGDKFNLAQFTGETGFDRDDTHNLCSVTKSFTSALVGIAIDKGYIQSIDQTISEYFPEYQSMFNESSARQTINIEHLLTMTSGISWDDETYPYSDPRNDIHQLFSVGDPIRYILSKDMSENPGTFYAYRNCNTNLLGQIIYKATSKRLYDFSEEYLFSKLGITEFEWQMLHNNVVFCSGDLRLRPRDMAKFGYLFLNNGIWNNERIISQNWIETSTRKHIDPNNYTTSFSWADGYGYQWWIWDDINGIKFEAFFASGWGGQCIIISPSMNMVIVSTAGNYYTEMKMPIENIISNYIIPSAH